jgi:Mrp family chromosome partitioning ATPase
LITPALAPEIPFGTGRKKLLIIFLAAALAAGLIVPIAIDIVDKRIRTVNDAEKLMGIPPAGWQIERKGSAEQLLADEQLRRIASSLMRSRERSNQHVFGFTGVKSGSGTTSLIFDISATLRALGFKVLVVEANGFTRDARYASGRPGLIELLRDEVRIAEVFAPAHDDLPPRVSIGGSGRVAIERLDRLREALTQWSASADFVLVDLPPLLSSADAELMIPTIGQLILVVHAGVVSRGELGRARRLLQTLDPNAVGFIVNRVLAFAGGGYMKDLLIETASGRRADQVAMPSMWQGWRARLAAYRPWRKGRSGATEAAVQA